MSDRLLSETVTRKFEESFDVSEWEVLSDDGWVDIEASNKTIKYQVYDIELANGLKLSCADNHILIKSDHSEVFAKDSLGSKIITKNGSSYVTSVKPTDNFENMYDLSVSGNHLYFTNGILSHNSIKIGSYILWKIIFTNGASWGIAANKRELAVEILDKIKQMYMRLPIWMQHGIKTWNVTKIILDNDSKILTSATNGDSFRGFTFAGEGSGIMVDEVAFIHKNKWHAFQDSIMPTISSDPNSQIIMCSTPKGLNHWYDLFNDSLIGKSEFANMMWDWTELPQAKDPEWRISLIKTHGPVYFSQNYGCVAGNSIVNIEGIGDTTIEELYGDGPLFLRPKKILTPTGYQYFLGVRKTFKDSIEICTDNGCKIIASIDHKFIVDGKTVLALNVACGDELETKFGKSKISTITKGIKIPVYDPIEVEGGHAYYANDIVHHNCNFIGSSNTLIDSEYIIHLTEHVKSVKAVSYNDHATVYEKPIKDAQYVVTVDVSKGKGLDYHVVQVTRILGNEHFKQVAVYRNNTLSNFALSGVVHKIATEYNNALVLIEANNGGDVVGRDLVNELYYDNLIRIKKHKKTKELVPSLYSGDYGLHQSAKTKRKGTSNLKILIETGKYEINDANTVDELKRFTADENGNYAADAGHDDIVMSMVLFAWLIFEYNEFHDMEFRKEIKEELERELIENTAPFVFYDNGIDIIQPGVAQGVHHF